MEFGFVPRRAITQGWFNPDFQVAIRGRDALSPAEMLSDFWSVRTIQLILNYTEHQLFASLFILLIRTHKVQRCLTIQS